MAGSDETESSKPKLTERLGDQGIRSYRGRIPEDSNNIYDQGVWEFLRRIPTGTDVVNINRKCRQGCCHICRLLSSNGLKQSQSFWASLAMQLFRLYIELMNANGWPSPLRLNDYQERSEDF